MKFGVREIVDVVFKAADTMRIGNKVFKKYQPVFMIDTATTSSLEQSTTTVYAQGGKGYARLIAWEGEKTMTFTVTDALMSPMGLTVLTGAGLINPTVDKPVHVHCTLNKALLDGKAIVELEDLIEETGLDTATSFQICTLSDVQPFATKLDGSGAGIDWYSNVTLEGATEGAEFVEVKEGKPAVFAINDDGGNAASGTVQLDFYLLMNNSAAVTEVQIEPSSFGGYFYVEAQTLFRREDSGKDMAAEIIIPKAKVQSAFTFTMAASGDPSTFDFVMDAMPGYTRFDHTKKQMCVIQMLGTDKVDSDEEAHLHTEFPNPDSPIFSDGNQPTTPYFHTVTSGVPATAEGLSDDEKANQAKLSVAKALTTDGDKVTINVAGGTDSLISLVPTGTTWPAGKWVAIDYNTGEATIDGITYKSLTNGSEHVFDQTDIDEAAALGLGAGHFVLWTRADGELPAEFTLTKGDKSLKASVNFA